MADPKVRQLLGSEITTIVENADSAASFLLWQPIAGPAPARAAAQGDSLGDLSILEQGPILTREQLSRLQGAVLSARTYYNDTLMCVPMPGIGFRLWHQGRHVDIAVCYECLMWKFKSGSAPQWDSGSDFEGSWRELFDLAQELFPGVTKLAKLPQKAEDFMRNR